MQRAGFWYLLFLFASFFSIVCGDSQPKGGDSIQLKVDDSPVVGVPSTVTWTRRDNAPEGFSIRPVFQNGTKHGSAFAQVNSKSSTGTVSVTFNHTGPHILQAFDGNGGKNNKDLVGSSPAFTVQNSTPPPTTSTISTGSSSTAPPSTASTPSSSISSTIPPPVTTSSLSGTTIISLPFEPSVPSVTASLSTSYSSTMTSPSNDLSSRTPIIVGSTIGTLVFVLILAAILIIFLRRRRKRYISPMFSQARMVNSSGKDDDSPFPIFNNHNPDLEAAYRGVQLAPPTYRHPTFSGGFSVDQKSSMFLDDQESTLRFVPLTDRQMELEERIIEWQSQLIGADKGTVQRVQTKIATLKQLQGSDWARERTDEVPAGLYKE